MATVSDTSLIGEARDPDQFHRLSVFSKERQAPIVIRFFFAHAS
jgi:hypothetical protein